MAHFDEIAFEYCLSEMANSVSHEIFLKHFEVAIQILGFKYFVLGFGHCRGILQKCDGFIYAQNYPKRFVAWYERKLAANVDTVLNYISMNRSTWACWKTIDANLLKAARLSDTVKDGEAYQLWLCAEGYLLKNGIALAHKFNDENSQFGLCLVADYAIDHEVFLKRVRSLMPQINLLMKYSYAYCPSHKITAEKVGLTELETRIALLVSEDFSQEEIAEKLGRSASSVKTYHKSGKKKLLGQNESSDRTPRGIMPREYRRIIKSFGFHQRPRILT